MPDDDEKNPQNEGDDKGNRMDAAKAFFRAMYAGDEPANNQPGSASSENVSPADSRRLKELEQQNKELEQKATEAENLYRRMAADFDNFRRRIEREREEFTNVGVRKAAEAIIPALDDLDRAIMYLNAESPPEKLFESFQLISSRFTACLESAGMKRLKTQGEVFDPRFHEPVQQIETTEQADGTIIHELRGGYILGDKVIRPALVNVASNASGVAPAANTAPASAPENNVERETKSASVATATEEAAQSAPAAKPDDTGVYDLGSLDDMV